MNCENSKIQFIENDKPSLVAKGALLLNKKANEKNAMSCGQVKKELAQNPLARYEAIWLTNTHGSVPLVQEDNSSLTLWFTCVFVKD